VVIDGLRTLEQQLELVDNGKSWTLASKHLEQADGYSHAVDLLPLRNSRAAEDWEAFRTLSEYMFMAARFLNVKLIWGGNWGVRDGYHYELG